MFLKIHPNINEAPHSRVGMTCKYEKPVKLNDWEREVIEALKERLGMSEVDARKGLKAIILLCGSIESPRALEVALKTIKNNPSLIRQYISQL